MENKFAYLVFFPLLLSTILAGVSIGYLYQMVRSLPDIEVIREYIPDQITSIYAEDKQPIARFCSERRIIIPLAQINKHLINAVLSIEDANFYKHKGIYWPRIIQAFWNNLRAGSYVEGASTITQQLTRSIFLYPQKTISRKIKEAVLAYKIEQRYSKKEILELYLNQIYFGNGAYGIEMASQSYFKKKAKNLTIAEAALLAGLIKAPSKYSPANSPDLAKKRCRVVLKRMLDEGFITKKEYKAALKFPFRFHQKEEKIAAPYFVEYVRQYLQEQYGQIALYSSGFEVYTCLDVNLQEMAQRSLRWGLEQLDKRQGFRPVPPGIQAPAPEEKIQEVIRQRRPYETRLLGIVKKVFDDRVAVDILGWPGEIKLKDMEWAKVNHPSQILKTGDRVWVKIKGYKEAGKNKQTTLVLALDQEPEVQGALVALDPKTGFIRAMVGGYDFSKSKFNRAVQARRQPGSSFKPFIYLAALLRGKKLSDIIIDEPVVYKDELKNKDWSPANYSKKFYGPTTIRKAMEISSNVVTVKLLEEVGLDYTIDLAEKMGITSPLAEDLSLALGSSGVSLLELTSAYGVFANQGFYNPPLAIKHILDNKGETLMKNETSRRRVIDEQTNYLMISMLEGVVQHGTGHMAKSLGYPVAGKTGTTNEYIDAWFVGFSPDLVAGVWVGFDEYRSLGEKETGTRITCPIWVKFMAGALRSREAKNFPVPDGITFISIDADTGLRATSDCENVILEIFKEGEEPKEVCHCRQRRDRFVDMDYEGSSKSLPRESAIDLPGRRKTEFSPD